MTFPILKNLCLFTDFGPILAWILLGTFRDFLSADKVGVCNFGFRGRVYVLLLKTRESLPTNSIVMSISLITVLSISRIFTALSTRICSSNDESEQQRVVYIQKVCELKGLCSGYGECAVFGTEEESLYNAVIFSKSRILRLSYLKEILNLVSRKAQKQCFCPHFCYEIFDLLLMQVCSTTTTWIMNTIEIPQKNLHSPKWWNSPSKHYNKVPMGSSSWLKVIMS